MMTLHEMNKKYGIKMPKLRQMEKDGALNCRDASPVEPMIRYFQKRRELTVPYLVQLIDQPELIELFTDAARRRVERIIAALGDVQPAPADVAACIIGAYEGDPGDVRTVLEWCKRTIPPAGEVPHHYLAVRLLMGVPENLRQYEEKRLPRVLLNVRRSDDFAGWWRIAARGSRSVTLYSQPLDL